MGILIKITIIKIYNFFNITIELHFSPWSSPTQIPSQRGSTISNTQLLGLPYHSDQPCRRGKMLEPGEVLWARLLIFHWPKVSHRATPNCKGSWEMKSSCVPRKMEKKE